MAMLGEELMPKLMKYLSWMMEKVAESNDERARAQRGGIGNRMSVFQGLRRPAISLEKYMERIFRYANCSPSCFVVAYVYLERFAHSQPSLPINSLNVHRLLITSVMVAAKFMDDLYYNNAYYGRVGGISTTEMNYLELDFLFGLSFNLNITPDTFHSYSSYLHKETLMLHPPPPPPPHRHHPPPVINNAETSSSSWTRSDLKVQYNSCLNDEETSHQKQQLAV